MGTLASLWCIFNYCLRHLSLNMSITVKNAYTYPCCFWFPVGFHSLLRLVFIEVILYIITEIGYFSPPIFRFVRLLFKELHPC